MQIKNHILTARSILFWQDFLASLICLTIWSSIIFLLFIELETIYYFLPFIKLRVLFTILGLFGLYFLFWIYRYFRSQRNLLKRYKIEILSLRLGQAAFPDKHDTIINAYQLESAAEKNESKELVDSYVNKVSEKLMKLDYFFLLQDPKINKLKMGLLGTWVFLVLIFSLQYNNAANAFYRWAHPKQEFHAPKPFSLQSLTGSIHILGGEKAEIKIQSYDAEPDSVSLHLNPIQTAMNERDLLTLVFSSARDSTGFYKFTLPELFQDYAYEAIVKANHFWEGWGKVTSNSDTIFVTDRPIFESFLISVIPPTYSKLETETQEGNIAVIQGLKGSKVQIYLSSNRILESAYLDINGEKSTLTSTNRSASGYFSLMKEGSFSINIVDQRGITNRDPVPYSLEIIPDLDPSLLVIQPSPVIELGSNQSIPIHLEIEDDYGFTELQVAYEIRRPSYLQADPYVSMFPIYELNSDTTVQSLQTLWELNDMVLMPEDEVHFHFELMDNDEVSGPKKTISSTFIARVPSLADLYETAENNELDFIEEVSSSMDEFQELKNQFDALELEALKTKEMDWNQQQSVKNSLENAKDELANLEKMAAAIDLVTEQAQKHKLFSSDLLDKFKELSELIRDIIPNEMLNNMNDLKQALEEMDMKKLQESLNSLAENLDQIEQGLDRYLDIFKRLQAEQKMDELQNRMQQLYNQQIALDEKINQTDNFIDKSTLARLEQEEKRNLEEFTNVKSLMREASELVEPYSQNTAQNLAEIAHADLTEHTEKAIMKTMQNLSNQKMKMAKESSQKALQNMEVMIEQLMQIKQQFQQETVSKMTVEFQLIMQDILYISSEEEQLRSDVKLASRNSPRLREFAARQQLLQDQLQSITNQMMELSKQTFAITPEIGRGIGKANARMKEAKNKLTDRNISQARQNQKAAMEGLNETALGLFNSIQSMQQAGSASGYEQFLQMMQQMAGQQQSLNQQGMQLSLGQMAAAAQQQMLQQMLQKQQGLRKSLEKMMNEMRHSGQKGMGDLSGIGKEMDEVIKDLQKNIFNRKTKERQQRILTRMLDSQTSMTQRGFDDERKSTVADGSVFYEGPGGLPADLGQRQNLALQALNKAINAGYSRENQTMIKRYFNSLSQIKTVQKSLDNYNEE